MIVRLVVRPRPMMPSDGPLNVKPSAQALRAVADTWWLKEAHARLNRARRALYKARAKRPKLAFRDSGRPFYADLGGGGVQLWWRAKRW